MTRFVPFLTVIALLAGCSGNQASKPIVIDRAKVIQGATLTLGATEAAVSDYMARKPIPPKDLANFVEADQAARTAIDRLNASVASEFPDVAQRVAADLQMLVSALPMGVLPPGVEAGLVAFNGLVQIVAQMAPQAVAQAPTVPAPGASEPAAVTGASAVPAVVAPPMSATAPLPPPPAALQARVPVHPGAPKVN